MKLTKFITLSVEKYLEIKPQISIELYCINLMDYKVKTHRKVSRPNFSPLL
ncbi:MAG: hypothetical protein JJE21_03405 [Spirochaetaceae bacterium]|nr:hypothetical protein [Spirochaetaceae bacterium]